MKSNFIGIHEIGEFSVFGGALEVTDPCYAPQDGVVVKNVRNGQYIGFTEIVDEGAWGGRNATLYAINKDYLTNNKVAKEGLAQLSWQEHEEYFGVDSGQGGIFDTSKYQGGENEEFYDRCCDITLQGLGAGSVDFGVVSSSGFGDGGYGFDVVYDGQEVVALKVVFIGEEAEEDDENEDE